MSRSRSLSPEELEHVFAAVSSLMGEYRTQEAVAEQLRMPDGSSVSQASISLALRRQPVGVSFARAVAARLGFTFEELVSGRGKPDGVRRHKELPGWAEGASQVVAEELLPHYVVLAAGESLVSFEIKRVDAAFVYDQGMHWIKHAPLDVRKAAERAEVLAARAAQEASDATRYGGLLESDKVTRGSQVAEVPAPDRTAERR